MYGEAAKEAEHINSLVSDPIFDAGELCRHVNQIDDRKRILHDSRDEKQAEKSFWKDIVRSGSNSSPIGAMLYSKDVSAVLRRQMATSLSQEDFSGRKMFRKRQGIFSVRYTARSRKRRCERR